MKLISCNFHRWHQTGGLEHVVAHCRRCDCLHMILFMLHSFNLRDISAPYCLLGGSCLIGTVSCYTVWCVEFWSKTNQATPGEGLVVRPCTADSGISSSIPSSPNQTSQKYIWLILQWDNAPVYHCFTQCTLNKLVCRVWWALPYLARQATKTNSNNEGDTPVLVRSIHGFLDGTHYAECRYAGHSNPVISYADIDFYLKKSNFHQETQQTWHTKSN